MKKTTGLIIAAATLALMPLAVLKAAEGWMNMSGSFNGWRQVGSANWRIENGEFVADGGGFGYLVTQASYTDFHFKGEFYVDTGKANSGVYFHIENPDKIADDEAYEANIFDDRDDQSGRTGGIPHYAAPMKMLNSAGKWNTYDILVQGDHIVIQLNGETTVNTHNSLHKSGPIGLQYGSGVVKFRSVKIRTL